MTKVLRLTQWYGIGIEQFSKEEQKECLKTSQFLYDTPSQYGTVIVK